MYRKMKIHLSEVYITLVLAVFCHRYQATENLSLQKPATQSSTYESNVASEAVDGDVSQIVQDCAHTAISPKQDAAWWQVDLNTVSEIKYIKIYYRDKNTIRRFNGFQLYIGFDDSWLDKDPCYRDKEPGYPLSILTVNCSGLAQYITIVNYDFAEEDKQYGPILELCEVEVFGCGKGFYGRRCEVPCSRTCNNSRCDTDTGHCIEGCIEEYYGTKCENKCSHYCSYSKCDDKTGRCLEGCTRNDIYGATCERQCNCKSGECHRANGTCFVPECKDGWQGKSCNEPCDSETFGHGCNEICHCLYQGCNHRDGRCFIPGCEPGWTGQSCNQPDILSLNKPATQSSIYEMCTANLAVDGNLNQEYPYCSHTEFSTKQSVAWWQLDLIYTSYITKIKIYHRNATSWRLKGFQLYVSTTNRWFGEEPYYRDTEDRYLPSIVTINVTGLARYITIVNYNYTEKDRKYGPILELCEVQVFGIVATSDVSDFKSSTSVIAGVGGGAAAVMIISILISVLIVVVRRRHKNKKTIRQNNITKKPPRVYDDDEAN